MLTTSHESHIQKYYRDKPFSSLGFFDHWESYCSMEPFWGSALALSLTEDLCFYPWLYFQTIVSWACLRCGLPLEAVCFFLAALGLPWAVRAFPRCSEQEAALVSMCGLLTAAASLVEQRLWSPGFSSCSTWAEQWWSTGLAAPQHVDSSWTRDQTSVSCIGRQILIYCTTKEVLEAIF